MKGALKSVTGLDDVHVDAETVRSVHPCIGEVLDTKSSVGVRDRIDEYPRGGDDLNRTAEVLSAIFVSAEESHSYPCVEGYESVPAAQGKAWNNGRHQTGLVSRCQKPRASDQFRLQAPPALTQRSRPGKLKDRGHVGQIEIVFLLFPHERSFPTEAKPGTDADEGRVVCKAGRTDQDGQPENGDQVEQA